MTGIDINKFLNNFNRNFHGQTFGAQKSFNAGVQVQTSQVSSQTTIQNQTNTAAALSNLQTTALTETRQLNALQSMDRAAYAKEVMGLPKNINEFIYMIQRGMTQAQFNQMFANQLAAQRNTLSQLQAQILAQLQGLNTSTTKELVNIQLASQVQPALRNLEILSGGMINLNEISMLFQKNGKDAITKLIMSMTEASKAGITDLSQMKEMAKLINASISVASENNPQKTLKLLLMLYLPWLPLEDGVGFDLEIQNKNDSHEESDSILTITISTINYGAVNVTLFLETSNSVQIKFECSEDFPKHEIRLRIENEQKHYAMGSVLNIETNSNIKNNTQKQSANINSAQTTEINPYLLLMAHTIIKQVIDIDNNKTLGLSSHTDKI
ncbi:MAG: hypothetical protein NC191_07385 [Muribaculaceae bacterium]|nr:hypothetical protein [Muribaculaceae bacterium]